MAVEKKKTKSTTKSSAAKKPATPAKSVANGKTVPQKKKAETHGEQLSISITRKKRYKRSFMCRISPYLLMILAIIFTVSLVTVGLLDIDDGAGIIGGYIYKFICGLFGGGALLTPVLLLYIGINQCLFHIKWKDHHANPEDELYREFRKTKRRVGWQTFFSSMLLVIVSSTIGVFVDSYNRFDIVDMWESGVDSFAEGGVIGSSLAYVLINAFAPVISLIILFTLAALFILLLCGITPDYVVTRIQYNRMIRREEREAEEEERYLRRIEEEKARAEEAARQKKLAALAKKEKDDQPPAPVKKKNGNMTTVEDFIEDMDDDLIKEPEMKTIPEIKIGPSEDEAQKKKNSGMPLPSDPEEPKHVAGTAVDYDDETPFDAREYKGLDTMLQNLVTNNESKAKPKNDGDGKSKPEDKNEEKKEEKKLDLNLMTEEDIQEDMAAVAPEEGEEEEPEEIELPYVFPSTELLEKNKNNETEDYTQELQENAQKLVETLRSFKVGISEITYSRGPTITRYELRPNAGTRVRAIANLVDDIALNLATSGVRIEAPIPNKPAVGIEVPNRTRATVYLRDLIENSKFSEAKSKLTSCLGMDVGGNPIYFDITKMPHLLIAGATGMGKSVCINSIIISILYKARPEEVKLILIDPKKVEFNIYKDIPHLYAPIVSDPKKAAGALASAVSEMERRFELIEEVGVRDITTYNKVTENDPAKEHMPHMVIIIDELADLMMTAPDEVESSICRLAQKARAAGIHIIIGTQRPSVDVITGLIKANIPSRIACTVASQVDSRTIIDIAGAEKLIGRGDMLFAPVGAAKPMRVQGAFVSEMEVENIVTFIKENNVKAKYNAAFISMIEENAAMCGMGKKGAAAGGAAMPEGDVAEGGDSKFRDAVKLAVEEGKISTSLMQRRLGVGYGRAAKIIDTMEELGYVSKPDGNKPRRVLLTMEEYMRRVVDGTLEGGGGSSSDEE